MTVLLIGADQLGKIPEELEQHGCKEVIHWSGRKNVALKKNIPSKVDLVFVFHDFVGHNLVKAIKEKAKELQLPVIFVKRSIADIRKNLGKLGGGDNKINSEHKT